VPDKNEGGKALNWINLTTPTDPIFCGKKRLDGKGFI